MTINISTIEIGLSILRSEYNQAQGKLELLQEDLAEAETSLQKTQDDIAIWNQVQALFGKASEFARQQLRLKIQSTVSAALQAVFERDDISFEIDLKVSGGQPVANWYVKSIYGDTVVSGDPQDSRGGGVSDMVSLALRLSLLELARPKPGGILLLDEVGKHVSKEYAQNVAVFLKQYAQKSGRQIILITHQSELADMADKSYRVSQNNGISEVEVIA